LLEMGEWKCGWVKVGMWWVAVVVGGGSGSEIEDSIRWMKRGVSYVK